MKNYTVEGIILKRSDIGEAGRIITLFTRSRGKIHLVAKGVRKISSRRSGSLELFNLVKVSAAAGKGNLDTLTEVVIIESFSPWRGQLGRVTVAYELCEALDKLTADLEPYPSIFDRLVTYLTQISVLDNDWRTIVDSWLLDIVRELGYWPHDRDYPGDIHALIEEISQKTLNSPKLRRKLIS